MRKQARRIALLLGATFALAACGAQKPLQPRKGETMPIAPYGARVKPTAPQLLTPSNQARPERSDELLKSSEDRRNDDFDLPPSK